MAKHILHHNQLTEKGWTPEEITHAEAVLERAEEKKHPMVAVLDQWVYWLLLLFSFVGVVVFAIEILPIIVILDLLLLSVILLLVGLVFGMLFTVVVQDIHWMRAGHHGLALLGIPIVAILAFYFALPFAPAYTGRLIEFFPNPHNPFITGIFFAIGILAPYVFHLLRDHQHRRKRVKGT